MFEGKQICASVLGPLYNKSFQEKIQALDEALGALQERVSTLQSGAIVRTGKVVESVDSTTRATLHDLNALRSEMKGLNSMTEDVKISQAESKAQMGHLHDLLQAKEEAKRAMMIVLEETTRTSEC